MSDEEEERRRRGESQHPSENRMQRKVQAGIAVGALGTIVCWVIEVASGVTVPAYVAVAIDTALVGLVQYIVPNAVKTD